jgi:hypothetical protein
MKANKTMTQEKFNTIKLFALGMVVWSAAIFISPTSKHRAKAGSATQQPKAAQADDRLIWLDNYEAALKEARATGKPIFLEFRCWP